jgi:D-threo-aldose 1-dehydrogenase
MSRSAVTEPAPLAAHLRARKVIGLGTAPIGGLYDPVDDETAWATLDRAWEVGIRTFDTAPLYGSGLAERRLGAFLQDKRRDAFVVSTKVGRLLQPDAAGWEGAYFDFSYDGALRSLAESLDRLGLDRVDVALVHDPDDHYEEARHGAFRALTRLRNEGAVRAVGVGMNQTPLLARFAREADPDCFLLAGRYTLLDRSAADELLPLCEERAIDIIAGGVFNSGVLAGGSTFDYKAALPEIVARVAGLRDSCARHGVPLAAAAVQYPLRHPAVKTVLAGCRTAAEVDEDMRLSALDIPDALWEELE